MGFERFLNYQNDAARRSASAPWRSGNYAPGSLTRTLWVVAAAMILIVVSGCAQNYGRFAIDRQVAQDFRAGVVRPEYQYSYSGRDTMPYAIIAIHRTWRVPSRYWTPFDPEPAELMRMSDNIYDEVQHNPYGASIKAPNGETIGFWYSNVFNRSVRVNPEQRTVQILFRNPENEDRPGW
jgi:hypothetical protein